MSTTWVIIIIVLVLGVVIGNITLLKYSARFKFPTSSKPYDDSDDDSNKDSESANTSVKDQDKDSNTPMK
ncbi:DUF2897 family protein [Alteromonas macleodii]|jgi:hypothetical protein|uniref:DUF2897 family protein n=1 Tax=Alteromonas macleodii TaxID=28108 RepID=UPI0031409BBE